ncbi:MAG: imidazole glycerol phosphate synthase subunit HisH [Nitrospirae bacterium]|nr:MAG: imidazole glycerol phosphate synthase subunit HisH [Nitrospirota bacterium]
MIAVIDYGMGNLRSVHKAFEAVGHRAVVTRDPGVIKNASHIVLPGVGAFGDCMRNLVRYNLVTPIRDAIAQGKPFLGICLGLQVLFTESEEFGSHPGLGVLQGKVKRFSAVAPGGEALKIPHMGWNTVTIRRPAPPLNGIPEESFFYFVHSYYVEPQESMVIATTTDYGITFVSGVWKDNIFAVQFHPEKSQRGGLQVLRNFGAWT